MGQGLSCREANELALFRAVKLGDLAAVEALLEIEPYLLHRRFGYDCQTVLHVAAANGQIEILSLLLDRFMNPDLLNRHKQTPLMLATMKGRISCVLKLLEKGANILMFDSLHRRTCLHYAAYYGHSESLKAILSAASSSSVASSWGFTRFVNIKDGRGATPLHLASRQRRPESVHVLLENGALVCASTGGYGSPGSTPLHLAARGGSSDCIRKLLAWGADRLQRDSSGRIPYAVALSYKHGICAALLNPSLAEPLVWPSPLKFITDLDHDAKILLENALMEANKKIEMNILKNSDCYLPSPHHSDDISEASEAELCFICFEQVCMVEVQDCGHQMCASCILALCCHIKPNPTTSSLIPPVCPFCRSSIARLVVAKTNPEEETDSENSKLRRGRKAQNSGEDSCSLKGLSRVGSFGRLGRGSGRIAADDDEWVDKSI